MVWIIVGFLAGAADLALARPPAASVRRFKLSRDADFA